MAIKVTIAYTNAAMSHFVLKTRFPCVARRTFVSAFHTSVVEV